MTAILDSRIFVGVYPACLVYADRSRQVDGDYAPLAKLHYSDLEAGFAKDCPADLRRQIQAHMDGYIARRGEKLEISSSGQTVILGYALND